jgi:hypothetical protein
MIVFRARESGAQGGLQPTAAPGASMLTLEQMEPRTAITGLPFRISAPGSYCLAGSLIVPPSNHGILVTASNVTIDLNGFALIGANYGSGIMATSLAYSGSFMVYNGTISGWSNGIYAPASVGSIFRDLRIENNRAVGMNVGYASLVTRCQFTGNGTATTNSGLVVRDASVVVNCVVENSGNFGIAIMPYGGLIADCVVRRNQIGVVMAYYGLVTRCLVAENYGHGIYAGGVLFDNLAEGNRSGAAAGICLRGQSRADGNMTRDNDMGITLAGNGSTVVRNHAIGNSTNYWWAGWSPNFNGPIDSGNTFTNSWANTSH